MGIIDDKGKVLIKSKDFIKTFSSQDLPKSKKKHTHYLFVSCSILKDY